MRGSAVYALRLSELSFAAWADGSVLKSIEELAALAEKLDEIAPGDVPRRVSFGNSGAEAVEGAIKLAQSRLTQKKTADGPAVAQEIKVGGIFDLTGITSDVGKPYAQAVRDYVALTNAGGGINGKKIKLIDVDYGYKIPEAVSAYKRMKEEQVVLINGWGTGETHLGAYGLKSRVKGQWLVRLPAGPAKACVACST